MRIALVHDDLVQWGGAERVFVGLCEIFPKAPIYTSLFDYSNNQIKAKFTNKKIVTSFLQKIPGWKPFYKALMPFYPIAFEQFDFSQHDLVISHTTRFAKSIITKPGTKHVCYCHTPPRFLWRFSGEGSFSLLEPIMDKLRVYDQVSSHRVDHFIAGSENAQKRIKQVYGQDSKVVYPFIDLERFKEKESFDGGYFLVIARLNKYKRVDMVVKACLDLGIPLKVIGGGPELEKLRQQAIGNRQQEIHFLGNLSDEMVVEVLAGCKALIIPGIEDFGLTSLEAQAMGKPVIAYKKGGSLETVIEDKTGIFFDDQTVESLVSAIKHFDEMDDFSGVICKQNAKKFSKENFTKQIQQTLASLV